MSNLRFALRFVAALCIVLFHRLTGNPAITVARLRRSLAVDRVARQGMKAARRRDADAPARLNQARAWFDLSTVASMNGLFNSIFEDALFVAREENLFSQLVTGYSARGYADRVIPIYPSLVATVKPEGVDYSAGVEWTKEEEARFTPHTIATQVILTDERLETDPDGARNDAAMEMGGAIATKIDIDLASLMAQFDGDKGTAGSALTIKRTAAAIATLQSRKVRGPYTVALHPFGWHEVWLELGQPNTNNAFLGETANQALKEYTVGRFLSANWVVSANIPVDNQTDAASGVFSRQAMALDTRKPLTMEPERDASLAAWELNARGGYAVGIRRADYGVTLTHDATEPTG